MNTPRLLTFPSIGAADTGFISVAENLDVPFAVQRVFWTYQTPESIVRGRHAHHHTEHVLVAVAGRIVVLTEMLNQELQAFVLDRPDVGVYIPPCCWHTMQYSAGAVQLTLASTTYQEADYIREYGEFQRISKQLLH
ncbi:WxcM-like domain-containing protein [Hymenobacter sediminis]|uniref:sugar 3,4-ketoisomerase n=1 Tax=Hymenobacter sediminis TaxID=2218621 RepID=UPI000DA6AA27|nr:FdtA/QdtA family cupin domain-containing protein [Hymenobacter sediminis]RPD46911.1 WxcM-like domain-containing protein [Hymenobacter sediminis]